VYVGSQPRLPDPFGPAANGVVACESDGAIYLFDPATDTAQALDTDAEGWRDPWFSPDGRTLLVAREVSAVEVEFGVLPVDGGEIRVITPEPLHGNEWIEWSPGSDALILTSTVRHERNGTNYLEPGVSVIDEGTLATIDTEPGPTYATFLPPAGERILVVSETPGLISRVTTMLPDGGDPQLVLETESGRRMIGRPAVSPDGGLLAYGLWHPAEQRVRLHLYDLQTREDRLLADDPAIEFTSWPRFSPDGTTLFVERAEDRNGPSETTHGAFIDVATGVVTPTDLALPDGGAWEWSTDGGALLGSVGNADDTMEPHVLVDRATGRVTPAPWSAMSYPSWQRLAP
jgi:dipeptidyl aminopeptidase/acylaminoacyl peptidase